MKLVKFDCTVATIQAEEAGKDKVEPHTIYINPDDVQMVGPHSKDHPEDISIFFKGGNGSTGVVGTYEEIIEKLTTA